MRVAGWHSMSSKEEHLVAGIALLLLDWKCVFRAHMDDIPKGCTGTQSIGQHNRGTGV